MDTEPYSVDYSVNWLLPTVITDAAGEEYRRSLLERPSEGSAKSIRQKQKTSLHSL